MDEVTERWGAVYLWESAEAARQEMPSEQMIQPEDCAELVRALLRLSPRARVPQIVIERLDT